METISDEEIPYRLVEIFVNYTPEKKLISKIFKKLNSIQENKQLD